jgi:outer membrane lipoprotein SlyB|tara:strand:+ start:4375 stop:4812 length:438 start_codon:yes stop_codon:yes gene_type:complete
MGMKKLLVSLLLLGGCATQGVDRADQQVMIKKFYAKVEDVKPVKLSSNVKTGIVGGSAIGLIDELDGNHEDMVAGALAGAIIGGLFTAIAEGSNNAFEYALRAEQEGRFSVIQKDEIDLNSGCVEVTIASEARLKTVPAVNCINL